jgi:hypothetical protein
LINWWQGEYVRLDVVPEIVDRNRRRFAVPNVRFEELTAIEDIPSGDLLLSTEVLQYLPNQTIMDYLTVIRKKYRFAILTNAIAPSSANIDIVTGGWRRCVCRTRRSIHLVPWFSATSHKGETPASRMLFS